MRLRTLRPLNQHYNRQVELLPVDSDLFLYPKGVEEWTYNLDGESVRRIIIYLRSDVGCEFSTRTGGCTGCRHSILGTAGARIDGIHISNMYEKQFHAAIEKHGLAPVVCIYNEGNMLNENELPGKQLSAMLRYLSQNDVRRLVLESRVEYASEAKLCEIRQAAGEMEIEIGIGLESSSDFIRNELFLKETGLGSFEKAVARLRRFGIKSLAYIIVKPPFLNECQAIADSVRSTCYAFEVGIDAVSLEPIGVEPNTIVEQLFKAGHFQPCSLWSVIDVARQTHGLGEVRIGGFQFEPRPTTLPQTCDDCNSTVLAAIDKYNASLDFSKLEDLNCEQCLPAYIEQIGELESEFCEETLQAKLVEFAKELSSGR